MSIVPACVSSLAGIAVLFYKIDEPLMEKIEKDLSSRRKKEERHASG
jgi:Na+/melibiose symporter-like transporter